MAYRSRNEIIPWKGGGATAMKPIARHKRGGERRGIPMLTRCTSKLIRQCACVLFLPTKGSPSLCTQVVLHFDSNICFLFLILLMFLVVTRRPNQFQKCATSCWRDLLLKEAGRYPAYTPKVYTFLRFRLLPPLLLFRVGKRGLAKNKSSVPFPLSLPPRAP